MVESVNRSLSTIRPCCSAGTMISSTFCARAAKYNSISAVGNISWFDGSSRIARIWLPMRVPPGSTVSTTSRPDSRSRWANNRICVVLPQPSMPSKLTNQPRRISVIHVVKDLLQIFPRFTLGVLVIRAQKIRRMVGDHHRHVAPAVPLPAQPRHAVRALQQRAHRGPAQDANGLRLDRCELAEQ